MIFKTCLDCGANLDPNEICECRKEKSPTLTTEADSFHSDTDSGTNAVSEISITDFARIVKDFDLKDFRRDKDIPAREIIAEVRAIYPSYDKMLQSKCENGEKYGIMLRFKAVDAVIKRFAPEKYEAIKKRRQGGHKLTATVFCRVDAETHRKLRAAIDKAGYPSVQAWVAEKVLDFIKEKGIT